MIGPKLLAARYYTRQRHGNRGLPHASRPSRLTTLDERAHPSHDSLPFRSLPLLLHRQPSARPPTAYLFTATLISHAHARDLDDARLPCYILLLEEKTPSPPTLATAAMGFGDFSSICERTPLPLCPLVGSQSPVTGTHFTQSQCYSRSIELANTIIFQGAAGFAHIITLIMLVIMIIHVRSKFTAVGTCVYKSQDWRDRSLRTTKTSECVGQGQG